MEEKVNTIKQSERGEMMTNIGKVLGQQSGTVLKEKM